MPVVMASMLTATNDPRASAGASSAIYMGEMNDAIPMPIPLATMAPINQPTDGANDVPIALSVKTMPARMIILRRPNWPVRAPPAPAPSTAPTRTALTTISSIVGEREKSTLINKIAPEMTPVS
jgi:hypothetical protein